MVFIAGLHRSGTSVLHRCIGDHPETSAFSNTGVMEDEGQLLQSVYPTAGAHGGPGRFGFDERSFLTEHSELATPANAKELWAQWSPRWDLSARRLVEKSPPNLVRMRFLQALFPGSYFIVLLRHPVPVSLATRKWSGSGLHQLIEHWLVCHDRFEGDRPHLDRLLVLRYEQLVADPDPVLEDVFRFLDLHPHPLSQAVNAGADERYFERYREMATESLKHRTYAKFIRMRYEARVQRYGYSLDPGQLSSHRGPQMGEAPS